MNEIVPELHDLLKLTRLPHDISQVEDQDLQSLKPFFPRNSRTWQGVLQHHCEEWYKVAYPTEPETFHLHIADWLASSFSRPGERAKGIEFTVHKLWKPPTGEGKDVRLQSNQEIIELFRFCSTQPSWEEFVQRYEYILKNRAEDANPGKNVSSLFIHCKLTGQFYRILRQSSQFVIHPEELAGKTKEAVKGLIRKKRDSIWQLTVAKCRFHFFQNPFRARDLNIFEALQDLTEKIKSTYPDNVLFSTSNELLLIVSDEKDLSNIAIMAQQNSFWVEIVKNRRLLRELHPDPRSMLKHTLKEENLYHLATEISPPICDLCQAARATKHWPEDYVLSHKEICPKCRELLLQNPLSSIIDFLCEMDKTKLEDIIEEPLREDLCENCFSLRIRSPKLPNLAKWWKNAQNKIAWLKINLDFDRLTETLKELYITQFPFAEAEIRFSVITEFQEDYSHFLQKLNRGIEHNFGIENVEKVMDDLLCIKVDNFKESLKILQVYHQLLEHFFSAFLNLKTSPLKIAIVCANVKFPFFEVWRILEGAEEDIFISLQGRRTMRAPIGTLKPLIEAANKQYRKSALHKLAKIEETSEALAELTFQNRKDDDSSTYSQLSKTLRPRLDFRSIFTFARLLGD